MFQRNRLPHPAAAQDHGRFATLDKETHMVEHQQIIEGFRHIAELEIMLAHYGAPHRVETSNSIGIVRQADPQCRPRKELGIAFATEKMNSAGCEIGADISQISHPLLW